MMQKRRSFRKWFLVAILLSLLALSIVLYALHLHASDLPHPVCVMISQSADHPESRAKGLAEAEIVFEWTDLFGALQFLAVFTHAPQREVGPIAPLSLGGMDLAIPYGRVVCGILRPDAQEYLESHNPPIMVYNPGKKYISVRQATAEMGRFRQQVLPAEGWQMMQRRGVRPGGLPATRVAARKDDDTELWHWRWEKGYYQRKLGDTTLRVRALVVLFADARSGPLDSRAFPNGVFAGDGGKAVVFADGRQSPAIWVRRFHEPLCLGTDESGNPLLLSGPVWFHIVGAKAGYIVEWR